MTTCSHCGLHATSATCCEACADAGHRASGECLVCGDSQTAQGSAYGAQEWFLEEG